MSPLFRGWFLVIALALAGAALAQQMPPFPFSPSGTSGASSGGGAAACELTGGANCTMTGQVLGKEAAGGANEDGYGFVGASAEVGMKWDDGVSDTLYFKPGGTATYMLSLNAGTGSTFEVQSTNADDWIYCNTAGAIGLAGDFCEILFNGTPAGGNYLDVGAQIRAAPGAVATPTFSFNTDTDSGWTRTGVNTIDVVTGGASRLTTSTTAHTSTLPWHGPLGTAALPAFTFSGDTDTGVYSPIANQVALTTQGVVKLTANTANLIAAVPVLGNTGTAAAPSFSFSSDTNTGVYPVGAETIGIATNGANRVQWDTTFQTNALSIIPSTDNSLELGGAATRWGNVYTAAVRGNNSTITIQPGTTAASAQGTIIKSFNDDSADAATLRIATTNSGVAGNGTTAVTMDEAGSAHTNITKLDSTGSGLWIQRTGVVQLSALTASTKGVSPLGAAGLGTCNSSLSGALWYKEDTDTVGTNSQLCLCARNNGALTYSWIAIGGSLTGTCT